MYQLVVVLNDGKLLTRKFKNLFIAEKQIPFWERLEIVKCAFVEKFI